MRRTPWLAVTSAMVISLLVACGQEPASAPVSPSSPTSPPAVQSSPATPAAPASPVPERPQQPPVAPAADKPQYGGVLRLQASDPTSVSTAVVGGSIGTILTNEFLWAGDWTKGPAGGYGSKETDWASQWYDIWDLKAGFIAEKWKWSMDASSDNATLVYQIRQGIHWALNPNSEASKLVNGRALTTDDVLFTLASAITDPQNTIYRSNPELRSAQITKTGPSEITITMPVSALANGILRFGNAIAIMAPEVAKKYGTTSDWKNSVGTGPFMLTDYIPGSAMTFVRNNNYWQTNPIGPGKADRLPYLSGVQRIIIPDTATQLAALRTGKLDQFGTNGLTVEDMTDMKKTAPSILYAERENTAQAGTPLVTSMRVDKPPFDDIRVRRALNMAIDYDTLNKTLYGGVGTFPTWPFHQAKGYETIWIKMDDPDMPSSVRELFTYNPDKARQFLKDAGFPNGLKTSIVTTSDMVDFYSIYKDMLAKAGVELTIDVKAAAVKTNIINNGSYDAMINVAKPPTAIFYVGNSLQGTVGNANNNGSFISDSKIDEALVKVRRALVTSGINDAMKEMRELEKYVLDQAYVIQSFRVPIYNAWWPWLKNYSGEYSVGYGSSDLWAEYVWIDQKLKASMGH